MPGELSMSQKRGDGGDRSQTRRRSTRKSNSFVFQKIRRRDLILLVGVLSLACFSVITVTLLILRYQSVEPELAPGPTSTPGPQPTHTVSHIQVTGLSQHALARPKAQAWAADAQLVAANANWPKVMAIGQIGEAGQWNYNFYSPDKERLFLVSVEASGQVWGVEHDVRITLPPPSLDADTWAIDSPAALAIWLDYGGADMLQRNPGLEVLIQLRHLKNHTGPVWMVMGLDTRTQDIYIVLIDAIEGVVIPFDPAG